MAINAWTSSDQHTGILYENGDGSSRITLINTSDEAVNIEAWSFYDDQVNQSAPLALLPGTVAVVEAVHKIRSSGGNASGYWFLSPSFQQMIVSSSCLAGDPEE